MVILLLASLVWTRALVLSQNVLYYSQDWTPFDADTGLRSSGTELLLTRKVVANNSFSPFLDRKRYQILTNEHFSASMVRLRFILRPEGLVSLFSWDGQFAEGVRISTRKNFPSLYFRMDSDGRYLERQQISASPQVDEETELDLENSPAGMTLRLNGKSLFTASKPLPPGKLGLEILRASVFPPRLATESGLRQIDFTADHPFYLYFVLNLFLLGLLSLPSLKRMPLALLLTGLIWLGFDSYYHSRKAFELRRVGNRIETLSPGASVDLENLRFRFFSRWFSLFGGSVPTHAELVRRYPGIQEIFKKLHLNQDAGVSLIDKNQIPGGSPDQERILLVGGSLVSGWGASHPEKALGSLLQKKLASPNRKTVVLVKAQERLFQHGEEIPLILELIGLFRPQRVILELNPGFTNVRILDEILREITRTGVRPWILRPPISPLMFTQKEIVPGFIDPHADWESAVRRLTESYDLPFIDAGDLLLTPRALIEGEAFWDPRHLTNFGHEKLATFLAKALSSGDARGPRPRGKNPSGGSPR